MLNGWGVLGGAGDYGVFFWGYALAAHADGGFAALHVADALLGLVLHQIPLVGVASS